MNCRAASTRPASAARTAPCQRVILVPVDLGAASARALDYALMLAGRLHASVTLLHVVEEVYGESFVDSATRLKSRARTIEDARLKLNLLAASHAHHRIPIECIVRHGQVKYEIFRFAEIGPAHLIVLARRPRVFLSRWVFGSVTNDIVDVAPCAVVVLPGGAEAFASAC
jgi:nucleotide-binding universal stress UspA family protein